MKFAINVFISIVAFVNLILFPINSFVKVEFTEFVGLYESLVDVFLVLILLGAAYTVVRIWMYEEKSTGYKILWSITLFMFPQITVPMFLWLVEPKINS